MSDSVKYLGMCIRMLRGQLIQKIRKQSFRSKEQPFGRASEPVNQTGRVTFSLSKHLVSAVIHILKAIKHYP